MKTIQSLQRWLKEEKGLDPGPIDGADGPKTFAAWSDYLAAIGQAANGASNTIESLQQWLKAKGFDPGPIDGADGPKTFAAWSQYQAANGASNTTQHDPGTHDGKSPVPGDGAPDASLGLSCVATCFGYQDPDDNGTGAFGDNNNNTTTVGVAVPIPIIRESMGYIAAIVHKHTVTVKHGDKVLSGIRITDAGPGEHGMLIQEKATRRLHALDLTFAMCERLGVKYNASSGSFPVTYWIVNEHGQPIPIKGLDAPKHYV
jgi:peptidoglycan hydrolase-like protein with peptidoglycan-binding domain